PARAAVRPAADRAAHARDRHGSRWPARSAGHGLLSCLSPARHGLSCGGDRPRWIRRRGARRVLARASCAGSTGDPMTTFHLIRHAEVAAVGRVLVGRTDLRLTDQGREHAEQLGARLGRTPIDEILSSPRERARETAEALARHAGQPVEVAAEIDEVDFGAWTGKTVD